jgi:hypothetical protein
MAGTLQHLPSGNQPAKMASEIMETTTNIPIETTNILIETTNILIETTCYDTYTDMVQPAGKTFIIASGFPLLE